MEEIKKEPITVLFILLNILIFLVVDFTGGSENTAHMIECGAAYPPLILENGEIYRLFTCMFLHFGIYHIANNMLVLFVLGQRLEPVVGKIKFILIYLLGGLGGNIFSFIMEMKSADYAVSAGASGAVFAVMGAMLYVVIRNHGRIQDISVRQMMIMAGFSILVSLIFCLMSANVPCNFTCLPYVPHWVIRIGILADIPCAKAASTKRSSASTPM